MKITSRILIAVILCTTLVLFFGCKKDKNETSVNAPQSQDEIPDSALEWWDAKGEVTNIKFSEMVFDDGTNISNWLKLNDSILFNQNHKNTSESVDPLRLLIGRAQDAGDYLTNRKNFPSFHGQNGIAYVWSGKDYQKKSLCKDNPPKDENGISRPEWCSCDIPYYGLDCSGFIYQLFNDKRCKLNIPLTNTQGYSNVELWNSALKNSEDYKELTLIDKKKLSVNEMIVGDIINTSNGHIGIVLEDQNGKKAIFNSLGSWKRTCMDITSTKYGPIQSVLSAQILSAIWQDKYHVLRFTNQSDISFSGVKPEGDWKTFITNSPNQYSVEMAIKDLSINITLDGNSKKVRKAIVSHHFNGKVPIGYTFHDANFKAIVRDFLIDGNKIVINFHGANFTGIISQNNISGIYTDTATYKDFNSGRLTYPVVLTAALSLNAE